MLMHDAGGFVLRVRDDGRGFDHTQRQHGEHFGLLGMQERARLVGGELTIHSTLEKGTTVVLMIPNNGVQEKKDANINL
jgi:signal transduction histidine kinase